MDIAEARRLLDLAYGVITTALPDRMARIEAMSKCCRMLAAVAPLPPLLPRDFRMREMVALGTAAAVVHQLLAGMQERFQWACMVLGWGYRLVLRGAAQANGALQRDAERGRPVGPLHGVGRRLQDPRRPPRPRVCRPARVPGALGRARRRGAPQRPLASSPAAGRFPGLLGRYAAL